MKGKDPTVSGRGIDSTLATLPGRSLSPVWGRRLELSMFSPRSLGPRDPRPKLEPVEFPGSSLLVFRLTGLLAGRLP